MADMIEGVTIRERLNTTPTRNGRLERAGRSLGAAAGKTVAKVDAAATRIAERARKVKEEKPLQLLAVLAGFAAVAGFTTRLWRAS
jgi:hypothetical protein